MKIQIKFMLLILGLLVKQKINAQSANSPTFEQTVDYIISNTKGRVMYPGELDAYSRTKGYSLKDIKIDKNGKIVFITEQKDDYNDFNISFNIFDLAATKEYPGGIIAKDFLVHFNGLNVSKGYGIVYATQNDALKIARAFRHLRTVCEKPENDLFSQPEVEEKQVLSKSETIDYINDKIVKFSKVAGKHTCYSMTYLDGGRSRKDSETRDLAVTPQYFKSAGELVIITHDGGSSICEESNILPDDGKISMNLYFDLLKVIKTEIQSINEGQYYDFIFYFQNSDFKVDISESFIFNEYNISWTGGNFFIITVNGSDVEKITKAFDHLKQLLQEEKSKLERDDPFGN